MPLTRYACDHCGFWQPWFADREPPACPVCVDVRNALPADGFRFLDPAAAAEGRSVERTCVDERLESWSTRPGLGLGSVGWVVPTAAGRVGIEATGVYTDESLDVMAAAGGLATVTSTHPHGYGALWQLVERFAPEVVVHRHDVGWTKAFGVTWPADDRHELAPGLVAHHTGGHFDGHLVVHDDEAGRLFCGDALKVDVDDDGRPAALSCHKAYHQRVPLSRAEAARYREVMGGLGFGSVCTPFEHVEGVDTALVTAFLDHLLAHRPSVDPVPVTQL